MTDDLRRVAVLYARRNSIYKQMPGCDVWDEDRDARTYAGTLPVVAHPPCARWSVLTHGVAARMPEFALGNDDGLFEFALAAVRRCGGVLEHPAGSAAWRWHGMRSAGTGPDEYGGWTMEVSQYDWGHRAIKRTWLYVVGVDVRTVLAWIPRQTTDGAPVRVVMMGRAERERTPPAFAEFLVRIARASRVDRRVAA